MSLMPLSFVLSLFLASSSSYANEEAEKKCTPTEAWNNAREELSKYSTVPGAVVDDYYLESAQNKAKILSQIKLRPKEDIVLKAVKSNRPNRSGHPIYNCYPENSKCAICRNSKQDRSIPLIVRNEFSITEFMISQIYNANGFIGRGTDMTLSNGLYIRCPPYLAYSNRDPKPAIVDTLMKIESSGLFDIQMSCDIFKNLAKVREVKQAPTQTRPSQKRLL